MIVTLTLNPCIDRTVRVESMITGGTNRVQSSRSDMCGKGINTAVALHNLGEPVLCLGFCYRGNGSLLTGFLEREGIAHDFVGVDGLIRTNIKIFDSRTQVMTEFNEPGAHVPPESLDEIERSVEKYLPETSLLILDGSVPSGVPEDFYRRLAQDAARRGVKTVIDASGGLLAEGVKAKPFLIKPNRDELEQAFGEKIASRGDALRVARRIVDGGVEMVCVSLGKDGALLCTKVGDYYSPGAPITVRGVQGAGDSLVAGMSYAIIRGLPPEEILRHGVATANGSLIHEGTQMCTRGDFEEMLPRVPVEKLR